MDGKSRQWYGLLAIVLALFAVYLPFLGNPLLFDDTYLAEGGLFLDYASLAHLKTRMLSYGSFVWLRDGLAAGWPAQRAFNLLVHIGVVCALWGLYRELLAFIAPPADAPGGVDYRQSPALGIAIGFFALNPVAVYAVAYLIQRSILLATLFVVLGLWAFAHALARGKPLLYLVALLCYGCAVLAKEHALMAPLAAVPIYILVARPSAARLGAIAAAGAVLVAAVGGLLVLRYGEIIGKPFDEYSRIYLAQLAVLGPDVESHAYGLSIVNQACLFFKYAMHWLLPYAGWMSIDLRPPFPVSMTALPQLLGAVGYIAVVVGGLALLIRYRDWRALVGLSLLLPAVLFATEFATVWVQDPFVLYRSYLWAIGIPGLAFFLFHGLSLRASLIAGGVLGAVFVWQAYDRLDSMSSAEKVWSDAIAKHPDDPRSVGRWFPYLNRGNLYLDQGHPRQAYEDFKTSAALGDKGMGMFNIATMLFMAGRHEQSLAALDEARRLGYDYGGLHYQRGLALHALRRLPEAVNEFDQALLGHPASPEREEILALKGRAVLEMGQVDQSIGIFNSVLASAPTHKKARLDLGMALLMKNEFAPAHDIFSKLIAEAPVGQVYYGRALANRGLKRKAEAAADIDSAIRLDPQNAALRDWQDRIRAMP